MLSINEFTKWLKSNKIDYLKSTSIDSYFDNIPKLKTPFIYITLDYYDFNEDKKVNYAAIKSNAIKDFCKAHNFMIISDQVSIYNTEYLTICAAPDYNARCDYQKYEYACIDLIERLRNKYHYYRINHPSHFNNHIKSIMQIYGKYYFHYLIDTKYN